MPRFSLGLSPRCSMSPSIVWVLPLPICYNRWRYKSASKIAGKVEYQFSGTYQPLQLRGAFLIMQFRSDRALPGHMRTCSCCNPPYNSPTRDVEQFLLRNKERKQTYLLGQSSSNPVPGQQQQLSTHDSFRLRWTMDDGRQPLAFISNPHTCGAFQPCTVTLYNEAQDTTSTFVRFI